MKLILLFLPLITLLLWFGCSKKPSNNAVDPFDPRLLFNSYEKYTFRAYLEGKQFFQYFTEDKTSPSNNTIRSVFFELGIIPESVLSATIIIPNLDNSLLAKSNKPLDFPIAFAGLFSESFDPKKFKQKISKYGNLVTKATSPENAQWTFSGKENYSWIPKLEFTLTKRGGNSLLLIASAEITPFVTKCFQEKNPSIAEPLDSAMAYWQLSLPLKIRDQAIANLLKKNSSLEIVIRPLSGLSTVSSFLYPGSPMGFRAELGFESLGRSQSFYSMLSGILVPMVKKRYRDKLPTIADSLQASNLQHRVAVSGTVNREEIEKILQKSLFFMAKYL